MKTIILIVIAMICIFKILQSDSEVKKLECIAWKITCEKTFINN